MQRPDGLTTAQAPAAQAPQGSQAESLDQGKINSESHASPGAQAPTPTPASEPFSLKAWSEARAAYYNAAFARLKKRQIAKTPEMLATQRVKRYAEALLVSLSATGPLEVHEVFICLYQALDLNDEITQQLQSKPRSSEISMDSLADCASEAFRGLMITRQHVDNYEQVLHSLNLCEQTSSQESPSNAWKNYLNLLLRQKRHQHKAEHWEIARFRSTLTLLAVGLYSEFRETLSQPGMRASWQLFEVRCKNIVWDVSQSHQANILKRIEAILKERTVLYLGSNKPASMALSLRDERCQLLRDLHRCLHKFQQKHPEAIQDLARYRHRIFRDPHRVHLEEQLLEMRHDAWVLKQQSNANARNQAWIVNHLILALQGCIDEFFDTAETILEEVWSPRAMKPLNTRTLYRQLRFISDEFAKRYPFLKPQTVPPSSAPKPCLPSVTTQPQPRQALKARLFRLAERFMGIGAPSSAPPQQKPAACAPAPRSTILTRLYLTLPAEHRLEAPTPLRRTPTPSAPPAPNPYGAPTPTPSAPPASKLDWVSPRPGH